MSIVPGNLTINELILLKESLPNPPKYHAFVISPSFEMEILRVAQETDHHTEIEFTVCNNFFGIKIFPSIWLKSDELFSCKNEEEARNLIGFIELCQRYGVNWRNCLNSQ